MTPSRRAAFEILLAVDAGGLSTQLVAERTAALDSRDAGLATTLVFGVLRRRAQLHHLIQRQARRPAADLDAEVRVALELGVFQLRFLDRIPAHAAVAECVELVKRSGRRSASGLVNAVLRRLPALPARWPDDALRVSMPAWILRRWQRLYGQKAALAAAEAALETPPVYVRVPPGAAPPEGAEPTDVPGCYRAAAAVPTGVRIMDIGAQALVELLDLHPGHRFLDLCAAPGNKMAVALETPGLLAVACDSSPRRLRTLLLPADAAARVQLDARRTLPFGPVFDRILADVPCSGTGTLARNPEIKWRLTPDDLARHAARQKNILRHALACLKPGGRLVYATCSLEPEENQDVLSGVPAPWIRRRWLRLPGRDPGDGFQAAVIEPDPAS